ncbi:MAG: serine/threonine-protein kinase [Fimbriiglobus sp.]
MSTPATQVDFLELVKKSGIVRHEILHERLAELTDLPDESNQLAEILIQKSILTKFQAKKLLAGKSRGLKMGSYVIREQIGQGGMGVVFLGEHETLRRKVAIKVLSIQKGEASPALAIERFIREARAAAALDHPNIVRIHDVAQDNDSHYLVMEYVDGQNLEEVLLQSGAIPRSLAVEYIFQAAAGLQHAHEKGFIHRDIKPANLMLTRDGTIKILDMGLAKSSDHDDKLTQTDLNMIVGTADFISPEQALNDPEIDIRTDIYSLGVTFFSLVVGCPPFDGNTSQKLVQHQLSEIPRLDKVDESFPRELASVIAKMVAKKPEDRYKRPAEIITALTPWLESGSINRLLVGIASTDSGTTQEMQSTITVIASGKSKRLLPKSKPNSPSSTRAKKWVYPPLASAIGAVMAVAAVGVAIAFSPPPSQTPTPTASQSSSRPATPVGESLWRYVTPQGLEHQTKVKLGGPREPKPFQLSPGMQILTFKSENEASLFTETIDGTTGLGLKNVIGATGQVLFDFRQALPGGLQVGRTYELVLKYATKGEPRIQMSIHRGEKKVYISSEPVAASEGRWTTLRHTIVQGAEIELRTLDLVETFPEHQMFIASVELLDITATKVTTTVP